MLEEKKGRTRHFSFSIIVGLLIIAAGGIMLLNNLDMGFDIRIWDYWPILLILIGFGKIVHSPRSTRHIIWGLFFIGIGTLFQLNNLGIIQFWFDDLWPILIIMAGIAIIAGRRFGRSWCCSNGDDTYTWKTHAKHRCFSDKKETIGSDRINISTIMGGGEYKISNKQFKGGSVSAVMGGVELDFRDTEPAEDEVVIKADVVMGSIEMRIPHEWELVIHGDPVLASIEDKTAHPKEPLKRLVIKGSAVLGSIEVSN
ncbi:MAG: cell wall-active antibiotics response protein [bacterium]|nr:cell wall-active antibiotics response protein [bacterium]